MRPSTRAVTIGLVTLGLAAGLSACGTTTGSDRTNPSDGGTVSAGTLRTDRDPITSRFPALGAFGDLHWMGWLLSDPAVPGPNDAEIQALVVLTPADLATAQAGYQWEAAPAGFDATLRPELRAYLPGSPDWQHSAKFEADVRTSRYTGPVYLDLVSGTVYLDLITT